jgi:hypothetical protein
MNLLQTLICTINLPVEYIATPCDFFPAALHYLSMNYMITSVAMRVSPSVRPSPRLDTATGVVRLVYYNGRPRKHQPTQSSETALATLLGCHGDDHILE